MVSSSRPRPPVWRPGQCMPCTVSVAAVRQAAFTLGTAKAANADRATMATAMAVKTVG